MLFGRPWPGAFSINHTLVERDECCTRGGHYRAFQPVWEAVLREDYRGGEEQAHCCQTLLAIYHLVPG
jgi:hypothetical protein